MLYGGAVICCVVVEEAKEKHTENVSFPRKRLALSSQNIISKFYLPDYLSSLSRTVREKWNIYKIKIGKNICN